MAAEPQAPFERGSNSAECGAKFLHSDEVNCVYLNGVLVDADNAAVSVFDHGLVTGDGVFETVLVHEGRTFALKRHLDRLERSAAVLDIDVTEALRSELEHATQIVTSESGLVRGKIRITLTSGPGPLGSAQGSGPPTVIVASAEIERPRQATADVVVVPWPRNERGALSGAKTISYAENVRALAWARARNATEALFGNLAGNLCEGTGSNVFVLLSGTLVTPPLSAGCLAGVTRELLLESGNALEGDISLADLRSVSEAFLCSTTRGVQPIARIDGRGLADCPGAATGDAADWYEKLLAAGDEP